MSAPATPPSEHPGWQDGALDADPALRRAALYDGALLRLPPTAHSRALADLARGFLREALGLHPRTAWARMSPEALFEVLGGVRRKLYLASTSHELLFGLLGDIGEDPEAWAFDPARLRVVHPRGEENPLASAVYAIHRDIWYGHPPGLLTWWIPLDDVPEGETFAVWPEFLREPVPNDSEVFDYDDWVAKGWDLKIGWQDPEAGKNAQYPAFLGDRYDLGHGVGFAAVANENRIFAGAHLHGTRSHVAPTTRFSLDLRLVHLGDHEAGRGAPAVDDRSRGCALPDCLRLGDRSWAQQAR